MNMMLHFVVSSQRLHDHVTFFYPINSPVAKYQFPSMYKDINNQ